MASSCKDQRQALLECLADSPCILAGKPISECVKHSVDEDGCRELNHAFFECKRGQVSAACRRTPGERVKNAHLLCIPCRFSPW